jgi:acyl carrier protein
MVDREYISECVFDCIPDDRFWVGPIPISTSKYTYKDDDLRLIEDLEMDSMDITALVYDVCSMVGISADNVYKGKHLETVNDIIDAIWIEYQRMTSENGK